MTQIVTQTSRSHSSSRRINIYSIRVMTISRNVLVFTFAWSDWRRHDHTSKWSVTNWEEKIISAYWWFKVMLGGKYQLLIPCNWRPLSPSVWTRASNNATLMNCLDQTIAGVGTRNFKTHKFNYANSIDDQNQFRNRLSQRMLLWSVWTHLWSEARSAAQVSA